MSGGVSWLRQDLEKLEHLLQHPWSIWVRLLGKLWKYVNIQIVDFSQSVIGALFVSQASRDMSVFIALKIYSVYKLILKDHKMCKCEWQLTGTWTGEFQFAFFLSGNGY